MSQAGARRPSRRRREPAAASPPPRPLAPWVLPLVAGLCFGLGYGITDRLLALRLGSLVKLGQNFEVKPFPGTSLESLRLRFGAAKEEIRGDLEQAELEQKQKQEEARAKREDEQRRQEERKDREEAARVEAERLAEPLEPERPAEPALPEPVTPSPSPSPEPPPPPTPAGQP